MLGISPEHRRTMIDVKPRTLVKISDRLSAADSFDSCFRHLVLIFRVIWIVALLVTLLLQLHHFFYHDGETKSANGRNSVVDSVSAVADAQIISDFARAYPLDSVVELEEEEEDVSDPINVLSVDRMFDDRAGSGGGAGDENGGVVSSNSMSARKRASSVDQSGFEIWNKNTHRSNGNHSTNLDNKKGDKWTTSKRMFTLSRRKKNGYLDLGQVNEVNYRTDGIFDNSDLLPSMLTNDSVVVPNTVADSSTLNEIAISKQKNADELKIDNGEWRNNTESVGNDDEIMIKHPNVSNSKPFRSMKSYSAMAPRNINWRDFEFFHPTIPCDTTKPCTVTETCVSSPEKCSVSETCRPAEEDCTSTTETCTSTPEKCTCTAEICKSTAETCTSTTETCTSTTATCTSTTATCTSTTATCTSTTTQCQTSRLFTVCTKPTTTCSCGIRHPCASTTRKCMKKVCLMTTECTTTPKPTTYDCNVEEGWTIPVAKYSVTFPSTTDCNVEVTKPRRKLVTNFPAWWSCRSKCTKTTTCEYEPLTTCSCQRRNKHSFNASFGFIYPGLF